MADSAIDGIFDLTQRYSGYDTKGTSSTTNTDYDPTVNYWAEKEKYDQLYEDKSTLSFTDMLGLMVAQFQNQTIDNQADTTDMMNQLESAYAITVHKAQGSEYRAVILSALETAPMLLTRGVLYTAMTRAKELLILVGEDYVVARMAANDQQQRRFSGLRARLVKGLEGV